MGREHVFVFSALSNIHTTTADYVALYGRLFTEKTFFTFQMAKSTTAYYAD